MRYFVLTLALAFAIGAAGPVAAKQVKAGVLSCDVSAGMGLILGSQKLVSCSFTPDGDGRREDYDGSITKYGLDLGLTRGSRMLWIVLQTQLLVRVFSLATTWGLAAKQRWGLA